MYEFESTIYINLPPPIVFDFMNNPATNSDWQSGVQLDGWTSINPLGLGSTKKVVCDFQGNRTELVFQITYWEPPHKSRVKAIRQMFHFEVTTNFEAKGDGTLLTLSGQLKMPFLLRTFERANGKFYEKIFLSDLANLKDLLEGGEKDENASKKSVTQSEFGAPSEAIQKAASALGVRFPKLLEDIWGLSNGLDLPGGWHLFPVFDPSNPKLISNDIVYENTKERLPYHSENFVSIAENKSGDHLVLRKINTFLIPVIYVWNSKLDRFYMLSLNEWDKKNKPNLANIRTLASKIEKQPRLVIRALARFVNKGEVFSDEANTLLKKAGINVRLSALGMMKPTASTPWTGTALSKITGHHFNVYREHWTVADDAKLVRKAISKILSEYRHMVDEGTLNKLAVFNDIVLHQAFHVGVDDYDVPIFEYKDVTIDCSNIRKLAEDEIRHRGKKAITEQQR